MNLLFFGDVHITERDIPEIEGIFNEIMVIRQSYGANGIIITGDSFDSINPTSKELDFFSTFLRKLNLPIKLLAANSHESTTPEESVLNHFGILHDNVFICKDYADTNQLYVGHFGITESVLTRGGTVNKADLAQYRSVVLGHFHNHEIIKPNIMQLGSVRYVDFGEDPSIGKKVAVCKDYGSKEPKWFIIQLKSPYPMISLKLCQYNDSMGSRDAIIEEKVSPAKPVPQIQGKFYVSVDTLRTALDKLDPKTKVRVIFEDYDLYREFLPYSTFYSQKFFLYKEKKNFVLDLGLDRTKNETISLKDSLTKYLEINQIPEDIKQILLKEIK